MVNILTRAIMMSTPLLLGALAAGLIYGCVYFCG